MQFKTWLIAIVVVASIGLVVLWRSSNEDPELSSDPRSTLQEQAPSIPPPKFVGRAQCVTCHELESRQFHGSHHDLAMQEASEKTVLGDFDNATMTHDGVTSRFFRRDGDFYVNTEGPDGELQDYKVDYTFGVTPLQQYLVAFPGGRYQVLSQCWDSRPSSEGGQRWYPLYPDESIPPGDVLHWTGRNQNWNFMCAECHSTNLVKGYDSKTRTYHTTFSEIDVSCEACHGPGSAHVEWAQQDESTRSEDRGFLVQLGSRDGGVWIMDEEKGIAQRQPPRTEHNEVEMCARCHSRRSVLLDPYEHGRPLLETHSPSVLREALYYPDGQIQDEVYVWGSFLQSRMYHHGVTCSDCHEPHSQRTIAQGNSLCAQCHLPEKFDTKAHHHHEPGSEAAQCVTCHMPSRNYMVVDPRRDHGFRIPRPDLTAKIGTPNPCTDCHDDQSAQWAADAVASWFPEDREGPADFAEAFHASRGGETGAFRQLLRIAQDQEQASIVRATAFTSLAGRTDQASFEAFRQGLQDPSPLVRTHAVQALASSAPQGFLNAILPLRDDPIRSVRLEVARGVLPYLDEIEAPEVLRSLDLIIDELLAAQEVNADRPEAWLTSSTIHLARGDMNRAVKACQESLSIDPDFLEGYVNLADLYRLQGLETDVERTLARGLEVDDSFAPLHHALGLSLVRRGRNEDAVSSLARATRLAPEDSRFAYVYAIALNSMGQSDLAVAELERAHQHRPDDPDLLLGLSTIYRDMGDLGQALHFAEILVVAWPGVEGYERLRDELRALRQSK